MKKFLFSLLLVFCLSGTSYAQIPRLFHTPAPPAGSCSMLQMDIDDTNSTFYFCVGNVWTSFTDATNLITFTEGSIPFGGATGLLAQDNTNFFWDNTLNQLYVGPRSGYFPNENAFLNSRVVNPGAIDTVASQGLIEDTGTNVIWGLSGAAASQNVGATTRTNAYGVEGHLEHNGAGTLTSGIALFGTSRIGAGVISNNYGGFLQAPVISAGSITNDYGLYIEARTGTNKFGLINFDPSGFGLSNPTAAVGINGNLSFETNITNSTKGIYWHSNGNSTQGSIYRDVNTGKLFIDAQVNGLILSGNNAVNVGIGDTTPAALLTVGEGELFQVASTGAATALKYNTNSNCADSAGAAACAAAPTGHFVIDAATTATVVSTTAVTANSEIVLTRDDSLGVLLTVTCNTQSSLVLGTPRVTARTAGTSFTVTVDVAPTTDPLCIGYTLTN